MYLKIIFVLEDVRCNSSLDTSFQIRVKNFIHEIHR